MTGSGQEKITIFYRDSIHCLLKNKDKNTKVSCGDEKDKIVNVTYQLTKNALIPEEFIGNKFTISLLNSNGKKVLNTVIGKSPHDKPFINFDFTPIKNPMNIQVENNQKKKSLFSYLFKTDSHLSGKYKLIKVPLPRSITTSTTTTTETPTTSTATPYSTAPLTTAMASTLSTDTSTSAASPLYPAALAPLLATGMLLTQ